MRVPSIPILVKVANIPPAGVKPPYMSDWNPAASDAIGFTANMLVSIGYLKLSSNNRAKDRIGCYRQLYHRAQTREP